MKLEVEHAVEFIVTLMRQKEFNQYKIDHFRREWTNLLMEQISTHWYPENSLKGCGYRCIRIQCMKLDPVMAKAARRCNVNAKALCKIFPAEFTLWIDPYDVCYKIGEHGSCSPLYYIPEDERPEEHRPNSPTRGYRTSPRRSAPIQIYKRNRSDGEDSDESSTPTSLSPSSPSLDYAIYRGENFYVPPFIHGFGMPNVIPILEQDFTATDC